MTGVNVTIRPEPDGRWTDHEVRIDDRVPFAQVRRHAPTRWRPAAVSVRGGIASVCIPVDSPTALEVFAREVLLAADWLRAARSVPVESGAQLDLFGGAA